MIDVIKQTPDCYSKQSLDYQILARLYTSVFNLSKLYADNMSVWDSNIDNKLVSLRATTLNFDAKHAWNLDELEAVTSCFKYLVAKKGTTSALSYCINILLKVLGLSSIVTSDNIVVDAAKCSIIVYADVDKFTTGVIEDLVAHLLPSGWSYRVIIYKEATVSSSDNVEVYYLPDEVEVTSEGWSTDMLVGNQHKFDTTHVYTDSEGRKIAGVNEI